MRPPSNLLHLEKLPRIILYRPDPDDGDFIPELGELVEDVGRPEVILPFPRCKGDDGGSDLRGGEDVVMEWRVGVDGILER